MAAAEPTGATTVTMAPTPAVISTTALDTSGSNNTEISKNDMFEEIKSKFLNEIDKIPCKFPLFIEVQKMSYHSISIWTLLSWNRQYLPGLWLPSLWWPHCSSSPAASA